MGKAIDGMPCDIDGCSNADVGTIHGAGKRCIECMIYDLTKGEYAPDE